MPGGKPIFVTDEEVIKMILFSVVNEACCILDDGVVILASNLDVASLLGMSFPSSRFATHIVNSKQGKYTNIKLWLTVLLNWGKNRHCSKPINIRSVMMRGSSAAKVLRIGYMDLRFPFGCVILVQRVYHIHLSP